MSSLVGHSLAAIAAARFPSTKKYRAILFSPGVMIAAVLLALLPDLDIIFWILLKPAGMIPHRGASHSLAFLTLMAAIAWLIVSRGGRRGGAVLPVALLLAAFSHPALDFLMGCGPRVMFFWPFTDAGYLSPVQLVPTAYYSKSFRGLFRLLFDRRMLECFTLEIMIFLPILLAQKYATGKFIRWAPYLVFSIASICIVYLLYK